MAMMTHEYGVDGNSDIATLLAFLTGIIVLFAGIFQLGELLWFIDCDSRFIVMIHEFHYVFS